MWDGKELLLVVVMLSMLLPVVGIGCNGDDNGGGSPPQRPDKVTGASPPNGATDVSVNTSLSWDAAAGAESYNIYFGTAPNPPFTTTQTVTDYNPGVLVYETTYYWRVDSANTAGTKIGDVWSFTTTTSGAPIMADFVADRTSGPAPLMVKFTDLSTGDISSWQWTLGDGGASADQSPTHTYENEGKYTVSLTVSGADGTDTETKTDYIEVIAPLPEVTDFTATPGDGQITLSWTNPTDDPRFMGVMIRRATGSAPAMPTDGIEVYNDLDETFIDTGLTNGTEYFYTSFTYDSVPNYSVGVSVSETPGLQAPVAAFSGTPRRGYNSLTVDFTDLSSGDVTEWDWDFDGDSATDSTVQNPQHLYQDAGKYTVSLTVTGPGGSDTETKTDYITVETPVYHSHNELTDELEAIAEQYPDICQLISIGKSVRGSELWFMKITDNVTEEEDEPEFKYISTMHGDEPPGTEFCLNLIHLLTESYGTDERCTYLVDETEIWIMPLMNPDGFESGTRNNAHGADLNRNFPDYHNDPHNTTSGRQPETKAVMEHGFAHQFVLSANFHTGARVVNYPYDAPDGPGAWGPNNSYSPDHNLFKELSESYSKYNLPMWNGSFYHGITNGAEWYSIYGGMQDWNYIWMGGMEVTIELYNTKWPNASVLPQLWDDNQESMLSYMEQVHRGVRGLVTDSGTGEPVSATITVDELGAPSPAKTDPDVGDYHRILQPGTYTLVFKADGYQTHTESSVVVTADTATRIDVQLIPSR